MPNLDDVEGHLMEQDVVRVNGGSVANLLAVWRVHGLDQILRRVWQTGVVLAGVSAGSICWFEGGTTDSFGPKLRAVTNGLGFLPYANGVHYDSESRRRPLVHQLVADGTLSTTHCTDDGVGMVYRGTELVEAVSEQAGKAAYIVHRDGHEALRNDSRHGCWASGQVGADRRSSSALTRRTDLHHRRVRGAGSGRVNDGEGVHRVVRVNRHGGLRILSGKGTLQLTIEVDLSGCWSRYRRALPPHVDPPTLPLVGISQVRIDIRAIVFELVEQEGTASSQDPHPRSGRGADRRGAQVGHHSRRMPAGQERIVLGGRGTGRDLGVNRVDLAEQVDCRVDHVAVQIEQDPAAVSRRGGFTPPVLGRGTPPFPTELVTEHLTKPTRAHRLSGGHMLGVESAVMENRQGHPGRSGRIDNPERSRCIRGQGLVDDHCDPCVNALPGLNRVKTAGSSKNDEIQTRQPQQLVEIGDHPGAGQVRVDLLDT
jgi:peptidase E